MGKSVVFQNKNGENVYSIPYFPVGYIYLTVGNENPGTIYGGTWVKMCGGYLYGCTNSISDTSYRGSSTQPGGSGTSGSTTLTIDQIPSHSHTVNAHSHDQKTIGNDGNINPWVSTGSGSSSGVYTKQQTAWYNSEKKRVTTFDASPGTNSIGGGQGHTHSIPSHSHDIAHFGVWIWKKIAH